MSTTSLFDPTNKLKLTVTRVLGDEALMTLNAIFSERVPNSEQADLITRWFQENDKITEEMVASGNPGILYDPEVKLDIEFSVLAANNDVLENFNVDFASRVSNKEQSVAIARIGRLCAELGGSTPEIGVPLLPTTAITSNVATTEPVTETTNNIDTTNSTIVE